MTKEPVAKFFEELSPEQQWRVLHEAELLKRANLYKRSQAGEAVPAEEWREWWKAIQGLLTAYYTNGARGRFFEPFPGSTIKMLAEFAGSLGVGYVPEPVLDVVTKGTKARGPRERLHLSLAVAYKVAASKEGLMIGPSRIYIKDSRSTKTIASWFGVDQNTVRKWVREIDPIQITTECDTEEAFVNAVKRAGETYIVKGRSARAILKRDAKSKA